MNKFQNIIDFIRKTFNKSEGFIPLHEPRFNGNEKKYLNECIDSTFVSSVGKFVDKFEEMIADYTGAKYAVACVNGTAALHIALQLAGIKQGDEVITQPLTFIATANAITYTGAKPVFIDVDKETLGLSPEKLESWLEKHTKWDKSTHQLINLSTNRRIAACVPMHTFGHPVKIEEIKQICDEYGLTLIEDAAESLGSFYKNKHTGTYGLIGTLSFNGNKIITTGAGGMIITDNEKLAKLAKHMTTQAKVPHPWEFIHDMTGYNYRLPNINAALGCAQLEQLPGFIENKRKLAKKYSDFFKQTSILFFNEPKDSFSNYWLNTLIFENKTERDLFLKETNDNKVMTRPAWQLMNNLEMYKDCQTGDLTNSEWLANRIVNIPSSVIYVTL
ncbi:MAG: LegC family aminotransferase [Marinilabiliales bacterium]